MCVATVTDERHDVSRVGRMWCRPGGTSRGSLTWVTVEAEASSGSHYWTLSCARFCQRFGPPNTAHRPLQRGIPPTSSAVEVAAAKPAPVRLPRGPTEGSHRFHPHSVPLKTVAIHGSSSGSSLAACAAHRHLDVAATFSKAECLPFPRHLRILACCVARQPSTSSASDVLWPCKCAPY